MPIVVLVEPAADLVAGVDLDQVGLDLQLQTNTYHDPSIPVAPSVVPAIVDWIDSLDR